MKASKGKRIAAFLIDYLIVALIQGVLLGSIIVYALLNDKQKIIILGNFISTGICFIYFLLKDLSGQSIGKKILKLKIQNTNQTPSLSKGKMILRNIPILIWPIEMILLLSSDSRLGDRMTNTEVIELNN